MKLVNTMLAVLLLPTLAPAADLAFRMQEIDATLKVGYGVVVTDVNGDGKSDIVVADANRVVWYENPTWQRRTMIEGAVPPDIVCIAACDIDRDKKIDFFIGADWRPFDTTSGGTIHWMRRGKTLDDPWEVFKIGEEPSVHRMIVPPANGRFFRLPTLLVIPLMGRGATKEGDWVDGRPVRILGYSIPPDPARDEWKPLILNDTLHVVHGACVLSHGTGFGSSNKLIAASFEGISVKPFIGCGTPPLPTMQRFRPGNQTTPKGNRGASEVKTGRLKHGAEFLASVEPWHGHEIVVYPIELKDTRHVIDDKLRWGHALCCAELDTDGSDWIIAGVRDDLSKNPGERRGVRIYKCTDGKGEKWNRQIVDDGGIACEDLTVADLNGDGRPDIIATGRQTGNVRIYWNEGRK